MQQQLLNDLNAHTYFSLNFFHVIFLCSELSKITNKKVGNFFLTKLSFKSIDLKKKIFNLKKCFRYLKKF